MRQINRSMGPFILLATPIAFRWVSSLRSIRSFAFFHSYASIENIEKGSNNILLHSSTVVFPGQLVWRMSNFRNSFHRPSKNSFTKMKETFQMIGAQWARRHFVIEKISWKIIMSIIKPTYFEQVQRKTKQRRELLLFVTAQFMELNYIIIIVVVVMIITCSAAISDHSIWPFKSYTIQAYG